MFRIRTAVDFPPVLKSDHTMRSCGARFNAGRPIFLSAASHARIAQRRRPFPESRKPAGKPGTACTRGVVSEKSRRSLDDSAGLMALAGGAIGIDCGRMTGLKRPAVGS
jgi:hypothetical protein